MPRRVIYPPSAKPSQAHPQDVPLAGGYREIATTDTGVLTTARFTAREQGRRRGVWLALVSIEWAETHVVAGANYRLRPGVRAAGQL
jgi:hypothetical protein